MISKESFVESGIFSPRTSALTYTTYSIIYNCYLLVCLQCYFYFMNLRSEGFLYYIVKKHIARAYTKMVDAVVWRRANWPAMASSFLRLQRRLFLCNTQFRNFCGIRNRRLSYHHFICNIYFPIYTQILKISNRFVIIKAGGI